MPGTEPTRTAGDESTTRVPDEVVADLLADDRCRELLACLAEADEATPVEDLARQVVARERDVDPSAVDGEDVRETRDDVFQKQLPKLTPTGLVRYDSLLGTVALDTEDERVLSALA